MPNVSNGLTEKMKQFAREYYTNGGNGTEAYLTAYNTTNRVTASREAHELLKRSDINEYLKALNIPQENKAISERQKKRQWLWDMIDNPNTKDSDRLTAMNILNKMDAEYINNTNLDINIDSMDSIDTSLLEKIAEKQL